MAEKAKVIMRQNSTGERFAGYMDEMSGEFKTVMVIRDEQDLDNFLDMYDVSYVRIDRVF